MRRQLTFTAAIVVAALFALVATNIGPGGTALAGDENGPGGVPGDDPPLILDGGWQFFNWANVNTFNIEGPFTFVGPGWVTVTDFLVSGDRFEIYDNNVLVDTTSPVPPTPHASAPTCDAGFTSLLFSWDQRFYGPGAHSITLKTVQTATGFPSGTGCIRLDSTPYPQVFATPIPTFTGTPTRTPTPAATATPDTRVNVGGAVGAVAVAAAQQASEDRARANAAAAPAATVSAPRTGTGVSIVPPSTGDGGLRAGGSTDDSILVVATALTFMTGLVALRMARR